MFKKIVFLVISFLIPFYSSMPERFIITMIWLKKEKEKENLFGGI